jgi:hypothetical protein
MQTLGNLIAEMLPKDSKRLRLYVQTAWRQTYADVRGLRDWIQAVGLRDPSLRWVIQRCGADRLVSVEVDAPPQGEVYWAGADCGLTYARHTLQNIVRRQWGKTARRYRWQYEGARRRFAQEQAELERVFRATVEDVWLPLTQAAILRVLNMPIWRLGTKYHIGFLSDAELARKAWKPISPIAYQITENPRMGGR